MRLIGSEDVEDVNAVGSVDRKRRREAMEVVRMR